MLKWLKVFFIQQLKRISVLAQGDLEVMREAIHRSDRSHADWHQQIASLTSAVVQKASIAEMQLHLSRFQDELDGLRSQVSRPASLVAGSAQQQPCSARSEPLSEAFYRALERHFRGSESDIRERQLVYQSWFAKGVSGTVIDLGCGGGEWLGLLNEWGIDAIGIDLNSLNIESLRKAGRRVEQADATRWLAQQPAASYSAITAFHVVEHLSVEALLELLQQARRVLKPGGLLLLETPNPENILVSTQTFWLDPTHVRPLPPPLLRFMVEYSGFRVEELARLNPPALQEPTLALLGDLAKVGRDYAVIARRPGDLAA